MIYYNTVLGKKIYSYNNWTLIPLIFPIYEKMGSTFVDMMDMHEKNIFFTIFQITELTWKTL